MQSAQKLQEELDDTLAFLYQLSLPGYLLLPQPVPEPDFCLFTHRGERIGIEHTRLFHTKEHPHFFTQQTLSGKSAEALRERFRVRSLADSLRKKDSKPHNYRQHYHQIWLLMVYSNAQETPPDFDIKVHAPEFVHSHFNKVFVLIKGGHCPLVQLYNSMPLCRQWPFGLEE